MKEFQVRCTKIMNFMMITHVLDWSIVGDYMAAHVLNDYSSQLGVQCRCFGHTCSFRNRMEYPIACLSRRFATQS